MEKGSHPLARNLAPEQAIIVDRVLRAEARPAEPDLAELAREYTNDIGNARRLIARYGGDLAYVEEIGWLSWDGGRWRADGGEGQALIRAQMTAEAILEEAESLFEGFDEPEPDAADAVAHKAWQARRRKALAPRMALRDFAMQTGNHGSCRAMLAAAAPHLRIRHETLDANPWLLTTRNATIDLKAVTIALDCVEGVHDYAPRRDDFGTKLAAVSYQKGAECPRWQQFVDQVLPEMSGPGVARFVQKWLGYCLTGDITEQRVVVFEGKGANGKSTLLEVVARIMGDYATVTPIETFLHSDRKSGSGPSPDIARLPGARLVRASEPEPGARLSESTIKQWTGGERMIARQLHRDFFEFTPQGKLTLSVNIRPVLVGKDHGIRRRILVVPFTQQFAPGEGTARGATLADELMAEAPGILNWLIEGLALWKAEGLQPPAAVLEATQAYFTEMDPIGAFIAEATDRTHRADDKVLSSDLRSAYQRWCRDNSEDEKTATAFGRRLSDLGIKRAMITGYTYYRGIKLKDGWGPRDGPTDGGE